MANDLLDAVVGLLEQSTAFNAAFGDTWNQSLQTGIAKVFADVADQVPEPYAILTETGETYQYMTAVQGGQVSYLATGQMVCDIWAPGRYQTRTLGMIIASILNDAPLVWPLETAMEFRLLQSQFVRMPGQSGAAVPIVFHRVFVFEYMYSGVM